MGDNDLIERIAKAKFLKHNPNSSWDDGRLSMMKDALRDDVRFVVEEMRRIEADGPRTDNSALDAKIDKILRSYDMAVTDTIRMSVRDLLGTPGLGAPEVRRLLERTNRDASGVG
jgi:predicted DNA-binding helix-hairpin-helix protein